MMTNAYEIIISKELVAWQKQMLRRPSLLNNLSKRIQTKINTWIPEKIHVAITATLSNLSVVFYLAPGILQQNP